MMFSPVSSFIHLNVVLVTVCLLMESRKGLFDEKDVMGAESFQLRIGDQLLVIEANGWSAMFLQCL